MLSVTSVCFSAVNYEDLSRVANQALGSDYFDSECNLEKVASIPESPVNLKSCQESQKHLYSKGIIDKEVLEKNHSNIDVNKVELPEGIYGTESKEFYSKLYKSDAFKNDKVALQKASADRFKSGYIGATSMLKTFLSLMDNRKNRDVFAQEVLDNSSKSFEDIEQVNAYIDSNITSKDALNKLIKDWGLHGDMVVNKKADASTYHSVILAGISTSPEYAKMREIITDLEGEGGLTELKKLGEVDRVDPFNIAFDQNEVPGEYEVGTAFNRVSAAFLAKRYAHGYKDFRSIYDDAEIKASIKSNQLKDADQVNRLVALMIAMRNSFRGNEPKGQYLSGFLNRHITVTGN
ncbi:MAG: hypothetical protein OXE99_13095 [Cellvibrionales bacterium]|nr:hypothetical protein [Cellvibrionales bacterium]